MLAIITGYEIFKTLNFELPFSKFAEISFNVFMGRNEMRELLRPM